MHTVKLWSDPPSYAGTRWHGYYSSGFGESRDSDTIERTNFAHVLKVLGDLSTACAVCQGDGLRPGGPTEDRVCQECRGFGHTVIRVEEAHWAVGWVAWIAIHPSNAKALAAAEELCASANDYPLLDKAAVGEAEHEHRASEWYDHGRAYRLQLCKWAGVSPINALRSLERIDDRLYEYLSPDRC